MGVYECTKCSVGAPERASSASRIQLFCGMLIRAQTQTVLDDAAGRGVYPAREEVERDIVSYACWRVWREHYVVRPASAPTGLVRGPFLQSRLGGRQRGRPGDPANHTAGRTDPGGRTDVRRQAR